MGPNTIQYPNIPTNHSLQPYFHRAGTNLHKGQGVSERNRILPKGSQEQGYNHFKTAEDGQDLQENHRF